jgi:hypothetical protein
MKKLSELSSNGIEELKGRILSISNEEEIINKLFALYDKNYILESDIDIQATENFLLDSRFKVYREKLINKILNKK